MHILPAYDPARCASYCADARTCASFNVFVERFPTQDPGLECPNPKAMAQFKCALFGGSVGGALAVNEGQMLPPEDGEGNMFVVRMRASNGECVFSLFAGCLMSEPPPYLFETSTFLFHRHPPPLPHRLLT